MGAAQQFSLRWNNYVQHITCAFDSLRSDEDLVDVTLSCEGRKIYAHKMLLSACSNYFKDVFKDNPCKHPVIIFRDVKYDDLLAIIDFMYHGEVNVEQEQLSSFLQTAEMLTVQGLSVCSTTPKDEARKRHPVFVDSSSSTQEVPFVRQNSVKLPSRPLGTQNPPGPGTFSPHSPRPTTPTSRKRRLSPLTKPNNIEKDVVTKRRPRELVPLKVEAEEPEDDGSFGEEEAMMDVSQLELTHEEADSPTIKLEAPHSPDTATEKLNAVEQQKGGQASTSTSLETADQGSVEDVDEEYLEEEGYENGDYETAYVVMGEDGEFEYLDATNLLASGGQDTILIKDVQGSNKPEGENMVVVEAYEDNEVDGDESPQTVEYIYAEGVNENNEIIIGEVPRYDCPQCDRTFKRLDSLNKHSGVHSGRTECPVCCAVFSRVAHRTRHMRVKHPDYPINQKRGRPPRKL